MEYNKKCEEKLQKQLLRAEIMDMKQSKPIKKRPKVKNNSRDKEDNNNENII